MPKKLIAQLPSCSFESESESESRTQLTGLSRREESSKIYATPSTINCGSFQTSKNHQHSQYSSKSSLINKNNFKQQSVTENSDSNNSNRFSCNELECLKERFVDFIKLDASTNNISDSSFMKSSGDTGLMPKAFPKSKSMQIIQDKSDMDTYQTFNQFKPNNQILTKQINQVGAKNMIGARYLSRLSVVSSEYSSAESTSSSSSSSSSNNRPEPPQRTVSIRNSACIYSSTSSASSSSSSSISPTLSASNEENSNIRNEEQCYARLPEPIKDDTASIRSSIYSTYRTGIASSQSSFSINSNCINPSSNVRSSRSVFSIYEEEDENCNPHKLGSNNTLTTSTLQCKLERLNESDIRRIESMYRSIGCIVLVSPCTCDLYTTTSEQIANLLNDCWKLEVSSIVPVWLFDTGLNPKRKKQLRLVLVDRYTAFPIGATQRVSLSNILTAFNKPILISDYNLPKNPDNDKRITFTLNNKQLVCLIQFNDFTSCQEFFKFFTDILNSPKHTSLFNQSELDTISLNQKEPNNTRFSFMRSNNRNHSQSLLSLSKISSQQNVRHNQSSNSKKSSSNRYSEVIESNSMHPLVNSHMNSSVPKMKSSQTWDNLKQLSTHGNAKSKPDLALNKERVKVTGITKNCISSPCAFQHINSIKDGDQRVKSFIDYKP